MAEGDTFAISALARKRVEVAAEIVEREQALDQLRADLAHLDGALRLLEPAYKPGAIRPKRRNTKHGRLFVMGELGRLCLDVLRAAAEPLSTMEIARAVMRTAGDGLRGRDGAAAGREHARRGAAAASR